MKLVYQIHSPIYDLVPFEEAIKEEVWEQAMDEEIESRRIKHGSQ